MTFSFVYWAILLYTKFLNKEIIIIKTMPDNFWSIAAFDLGFFLIRDFWSSSKLAN